ncbi:hypothetical protein [Archangium violaceum]|uniref:Lipoprotein n=1 Tax=Archangium violaceum Cb vi76 TaxID=1406225 RepID=A0A084SGT7_9BACT|nr:hypothetical protein [Archangium violaceum]KFA87672.1 hypothetical protein Q664_46130 [Archangium violaceum Cb vi76]
MLHLLGRIVALITVVSAGTASASCAALVEKNHSASYAGPAPVPEVPAVAPAPPDKATVVELLTTWYADELRRDNKALANTLRKLDASAYNAFLAQNKAKALACVDKLPAELKPQVEKYLSATETAQQDSVLRKLRKTTEGQPKEVLDCLSVSLVRLSSQGVLIGGLPRGNPNKASEQLKPTRHNPGLVYILRPQVLTAWPGRADSALRILDPRQGPWKVRLAHTYEKTVGTHSQEWKERLLFRVQEYAELTNNGHFLLVDDKDAPLGWLDMDQAAFFEEEWAEYAEESKFAYTSGAAAFVHGVWWNPEGRTGDEVSSDPGTRYQSPVYVFDFLYLIQMETDATEQPADAPYPEVMHLGKLGSLYRGKDHPDSYASRIKLLVMRRYAPDAAWKSGQQVGTIEAYKGRLHYRLGSATTKTTLDKIYRLP